MDKVSDNTNDSYPRLEDIDREIEDEFNKLMNSDISRTKYVLSPCLKNLYESFKEDPSSPVGLKEFFGLRRLPSNLATHKKKARVYCFRINNEYLYDYYSRVESKVRFSVERYTKAVSEHPDEKTTYCRLVVSYNEIDYLRILEEEKFLPKREDGLPFPQEIRNFLNKYLKQVRDDHRYLDTKHLGILLPVDRPIELDEIHIPLTATREIPLSEASHLTEHMEWISGVPDKFVKEKSIVEKAPHPLPVKQILLDAVKEQDLCARQMVFLGRLGSGKTTLLRCLAFSVASGKAKEWGLEGFTPVFVNLPDYDPAEHKDLMDYALDKAGENIADERQKNGIRKALKHTIAACEENSQLDGRVVFLLDALDETRHKKGKVVKQIESIRNRYKKAVIVVTSRIINYYETPLNGFARYLIEDLQITEIDDFIETWFRVLVQGRAREHPETDWKEWASNRTAYLIHQIEKKPSLRRIATTPLYLTFLVLLASDPDTELPETRAKLYHKYFEKLLFKWEKKHGLPSPPEELFRGFKEICWIIHRALQGKVQNSPTEEYIKKSVERSLTINPGQLLDFWIKAGILLVVKTRNQDELILPRHLSFIEYGFACKLADLWDDKSKREELWRDLKPNLHNQYLYEPLLLFVGKIEDPASFLKRVWKLQDDLFHNNLTFLGKAVIEAKNKLQGEAIFRDLSRRFLKLGHSGDHFVIPIKENILECLGHIAGIQDLAKLFEREPHYSIQRDIAHIIADVGGKTAIPLLKDLFERETASTLRDSLVYSISRFGDHTTIPLLKDLFEREQREDSPAVRHSLAHSISRFGDQTTIPLLKQMYDNEVDPSVKRVLATSIGELEDDKELAISSLKGLYEKETDYLLRSYFASLIGRLGGKTTISLLKELYDKEADSGVKHTLATSIGKLGDKELAILYLENLYKKETDSDRKTSIATSIGKLGNKDLATSYLTEHFEKEPAPDIKRRCAFAISELGDKELALSLLRKAHESATYPSTKQHLAIFIGELGDQELALSLLREALEREKYPWLRRFLAIAMARFGDTSAIPLLKDVFEVEPESHLRENLVYSMTRFGDQATIPLLKELYEKEADPSVKRKLATSIGELGDIELALSLLKELLHSEKRPYSKLEIAKSIHNITHKAKIKIFQGKKGQWKLLKIPDRYTF